MTHDYNAKNDADSKNFLLRMPETTNSIQIRKCEICSAPARYFYFGALACPSCKMFFKRNAENKEVNQMVEYPQLLLEYPLEKDGLSIGSPMRNKLIDSSSLSIVPFVEMFSKWNAYGNASSIDSDHHSTEAT